jgi:hypothetical protein
MLKSRLLAGVALATLSLPIAALSPGLPLGSTAAQAQSASVSFSLFFDQLEPHGVWVRHARYNYVFCPTGVDASWRPYSHGRWLYLEGRGWYFASDEPFAWATYHYGRWFADRTLGWCWVPGTKWAPAWVSWRRSDSVVGWAPLPPEDEGYAISIEVSRRDLPEGYWVFVPTERFVEPDLSVSIVIGSQQPDYFTQTQFLGPVVVEGDLVINNVIEVNYIEQATGQQVIAYQPETAPDPAAQAVDVDAQAIVVFDQDVAEPTEEVAPPEAVEEADAAATIETEGGTAGATAELPAETEAPAEAQAADTEPAAGADPATETPADATSTEATPPAEGEAAPAADAEQAAPDAAPDANADAEPAADAAPPATPAGEELACAPEVMVDGKCPPVSGEAAQPEEPAAEPAAPAQAPAADPAAEAPEPAPAAEPTEAPTAPEPAAEAEAPAEPAPAPEGEAAAPAEPAAEPEAVAEEPAEVEAAPAEADQPPCPPEVMVDGKCPPLPDEQSAQ